MPILTWGGVLAVDKVPASDGSYCVQVITMRGNAALPQRQEQGKGSLHVHAVELLVADHQFRARQPKHCKEGRRLQHEITLFMYPQTAIYLQTLCIISSVAGNKFSRFQRVGTQVLPQSQILLHQLSATLDDDSRRITASISCPRLLSGHGVCQFVGCTSRPSHAESLERRYKEVERSIAKLG
mmetsp:Transcript_8343/g.15612  ORF Transcript_8343/g.15612 Transcript_8343/m.15612 type:complete len:183 (-) Transcript_8343:291-839(-)